jgi:VIT1/CCC1 family predicted Fe2+/Mn2+ transporter
MAERSPDDSIAALFSRLIDDAERFVRAEIRLYRAQAFARLGEARSAIVMVVIALLLAQSAFIGVVVGLLLILRGPLGAAWATVVVVCVSLGIAAVLVRLAIGKIRKVTEIKDSAK